MECTHCYIIYSARANLQESSMRISGSSGQNYKLIMLAHWEAMNNDDRLQ